MIPMIIIGFIGVAKVFAGLTMSALSRKLATMPLEKRAKFLAGMSDEQRRKLLAEYGIVVFDGAGISLVPGDGWQQIDATPGLPICPPTLVGSSGMVRAMLFAPHLSDLNIAVNSLIEQFSSNPKTVKGSVMQKEFTAKSNLTGICLSYTERTENDGSVIDLRSYSYVVKNNQGRCVAVSYITMVGQDSGSVHQMILNSLRLE